MSYALSGAFSTGPQNVACFIILLYVIYSIVCGVYNITFHRLARFPGPVLRGAFYLPNLVSIFRGTDVSDIHRLHLRYGSVVRINPETLDFNSSQAWRDIYGSRDGGRELARDDKWHLDHAGNTNIIVANTPDHRRMRRVLANAFTRNALAAQQQLIQSYILLFISRLNDAVNAERDSAGATMDLSKWYNFLTFDIIGDLALGESFDTLQSGSYHQWIATIFKGLKLIPFIRFLQLYPALGQTVSRLGAAIPPVAKAQKAHHNFTVQRLERRMNLETQKKDFITYILAANDAKGMTRSEIEGTATVLIMAGSETTASALSGITYYILTDPKLYEGLKHEVRESYPTEADLQDAGARELPMLECVIREGLRMYPPTPSTLPRRTRPEGDIIDGRFVPGDVSVGVNHWSASRAPSNFAAPDVFDARRWGKSGAPDRYLNDDREASQPFSYGPRACLGKNLAYFEMRSILAQMLWRFEMRLMPESEHWVSDQKTFILWERPPLNVQLAKREFAQKG